MRAYIGQLVVDRKEYKIPSSTNFQLTLYRMMIENNRKRVADSTEIWYLKVDIILASIGLIYLN